jgi:hypothetical protein
VTKQIIGIVQATKLLAIKPLYNIYNVPGVYYCDKYGIVLENFYGEKRPFVAKP